MTTPSCVSCQERLSCGDSPLSITGNVIGILTFASAILISIQVYYNSMRNADGNIFEMTNTLQSRVEEAQILFRKLQQVDSINENQRQRLEVAFRQVKDSLVRASDLLERLRTDTYDGKRRLWIRAQFVARKNLIKEGIEKTAKAMKTLREVSNDLLSE
jgi:hypothetical protein